MRSVGPRTERALVDFVRANVGLLSVSLVFAILAYGYALVQPSLSFDEETAPTFAELGRENGWSVALYRWGLVAFQFAVIPGSNLPFLRPLLAIALLCVAATLYARLLPTTHTARYFFCLTFVTVPTFAYALTFSFMSIEFVLACLLFVLGLRCFVAATETARVDRGGVATALLLWVLAPSFYQDYGVLLTAYLVYLFFRIAGEEHVSPVPQVACFAGVTVASVVIYAVLSVAIEWSFSVTAVPYISRYVSRDRTVAFALQFVREIRQFYFSSAVYGTTSLAVAAIVLPLLGASVAGSLARRAVLAGLGVAICFAPFAYGLGSVPPTRAASGLLFLAAGAAAFAVARSGAAMAFFVKCLVVYLALVNCVAVNNIFHYEGLVWEADKLLATNLAQRIHAVAPELHDATNVRVLFVGSYNPRLQAELSGADFWVGMFDTWGDNIPSRRYRAMGHAGFPDFRLATAEDYETSKAMVERMPSWPDAGSVVRSGELVIVKLGQASGFVLQ